MGTDGRTIDPLIYRDQITENSRLPRIVLGDRSMHIQVLKIKGPSLWVHAISTTNGLTSELDTGQTHRRQHVPPTLAVAFTPMIPEKTDTALIQST